MQGQPNRLLVLEGRGSTRLFDAYPLVETFNAEHGTGLTVVSHRMADAALTTGRTLERPRLPEFAVDAAIAYEKPRTPLGTHIAFSFGDKPRVVLPTHMYAGEHDIALVVMGLSPADFKKERGFLVLDIPERRLIAINDFPPKNGWHMPDSRTGVPHGTKAEIGSAPRDLNRLDSSYVGLLVRSGCGFNRLVSAFYTSSARFGVVAEVPEGDVAKIEALRRKPDNQDGVGPSG